MVNGVVFAFWWLRAQEQANRLGAQYNQNLPFCTAQQSGTPFPVYDFIVTRKKSKTVSAVRLIFKMYYTDRLKTPVF